MKVSADENVLPLVRIYPTGEGGGQFIVNGKEVKEYFTRFGDYETLVGPLTDTDFAGKMDVTVLVMGGGVALVKRRLYVWVWRVHYQI